MELKTVAIEKPTDLNVIIGQSHFIKSVEDLYEAVVQTVPGVKFGVAFNEASWPSLVRYSGTDVELQRIAVTAALAIGAGITILGAVLLQTLVRSQITSADLEGDTAIAVPAQ